MTRYYAHLRGHDVISQPAALSAQTLGDAKREAWAMYGDGYKHHWIEICEAFEGDAGVTLLSRRLDGRAWQPV